MNKIYLMISIILLSIFSSCVYNKKQIKAPTPAINETPIPNISTSDITYRHNPTRPGLTLVPTFNITNQTIVIINQSTNNS